MSIPYLNIAKAVALRAGAFKGGSYESKNAAYAANDIGAQIDSTEVLMAALKQDIIAAEKELVEMIANSSNVLYRAAFQKQSNQISSGDPIPTVSADNIAFIGSFDGIFDKDTGTPLREMPLQTVLRRIQNSNNFFKIPAFYYAFDGQCIFHTATTVYFRGCGYDQATQETQFDTINGTSPLPQSLENLWICKVLAGLAQESWFGDESQAYARLAAEKQYQIIEGKLQTMQLPDIPVKTASVNPVKD